MSRSFQLSIIHYAQKGLGEYQEGFPIKYDIYRHYLNT